MNPVIRMVIRFLPCRLNEPVYPDQQAVSAASGWWIVAKSMAGVLCRVWLAVAAFLAVVIFLPCRPHLDVSAANPYACFKGGLCHGVCPL